jgi:cytochrome c oxidase assembly factor 1
MGASAAGIFNYQKLNHSVVNASLYALRMNQIARERLGDEIYFRDRIPWIFGTIDTLHGLVDVQFGVKGKSGKGVMQFRCVRNTGDEFVSLSNYYACAHGVELIWCDTQFRTEVWTLEMETGEKIDLLATASSDPMAGV